MPRRGDVFMARLDPHQGSEQAGSRPVVVVSRDSISQNSLVVLVVPVTDRRHKQRIYPSQVVLKQGDGGLTKESVALGGQVRAISTSRFIRQMGHLSANGIAEIGQALRIALDL
ncbi:MAG: type II toxin-antitoxin system PemK/MazF family toxin [Candidatus Acidiferrales bacterium]